jgi:hypothetical protein
LGKNQFFGTIPGTLPATLRTLSRLSCEILHFF